MVVWFGNVQATSKDGLGAAYLLGKLPPNYPVPAIPLEVFWGDTGYRGMIYIADASIPDEPIMVWFYDGWRLDRQLAI